MNQAAGFYLPGEEAGLTNYVIDALTVLDRVEEGHESLRRYVMETRLPHITARTLAVCAPRDHFSLPYLPKFATALGCDTQVLSGGHAAAPEQVPEEFARTVLSWVAHRDGATSLQAEARL
ncbi:hypothetical protein M2161_008809 [Streptomyces sp. SAI-133]|uniref:hypothetical protein n=1 Tax=unclassified Streptomyces TaxID=2593676 RepID=UPI002473625B|nr:hypothetical protein [Streptomyces sp. SAI-133]MDH6589703.1 hypothetical protein [Streptomyces sp. SAI-133]